MVDTLDHEAVRLEINQSTDPSTQILDGDGRQLMIVLLALPCLEE